MVGEILSKIGIDALVTELPATSFTLAVGVMVSPLTARFAPAPRVIVTDVLDMSQATFVALKLWPPESDRLVAILTMVIVVGFIASLKVALILLVVTTLTSALTGIVEATIGGVVSATAAVVNVHSL